MGGDGQAQTHLQVYTALAKFGLNIQQAIEMPRWIHGDEGEQETLLVEKRFPDATVDALRKMGHHVREGENWLTTMGYAQGIVFDGGEGVMQGGSDPRAEGVAAGW
jgi:gamma-glutamyltranspeptidase/glutathione hydrolase